LSLRKAPISKPQLAKRKGKGSTSFNNTMRMHINNSNKSAKEGTPTMYNNMKWSNTSSVKGSNNNAKISISNSVKGRSNNNLKRKNNNCSLKGSSCKHQGDMQRKWMTKKYNSKKKHNARRPKQKMGPNVSLGSFV
jgi:hypothetical protein